MAGAVAIETKRFVGEGLVFRGFHDDSDLCCEKILGLPPARYHRLRRLQLVHRALRSAGPQTRVTSAVARNFGFRELGRFAASYRALYGELPSATLRRASLRRSL